MNVAVPEQDFTRSHGNKHRRYPTPLMRPQHPHHLLHLVYGHTKTSVIQL
jgi:hypothetical protein